MIINGYTTLENSSKISSNTLDISVKSTNDNRIMFQIDTSNKEFNDFNGQIRDTINFLIEKTNGLVELREKLSDLSWHIDFGYESKIVNGDLAIESLQIPLSLIKLCSELGIEINISLYDGRMFK